MAALYLIFSDVAQNAANFKCKFQYVGKTSQNLNKGFNWNSSYFRNLTAY